MADKSLFQNVLKGTGTFLREFARPGAHAAERSGRARLQQDQAESQQAQKQQVFDNKIAILKTMDPSTPEFDMALKGIMALDEFKAMRTQGPAAPAGTPAFIGPPQPAGTPTPVPSGPGFLSRAGDVAGGVLDFVKDVGSAAISSPSLTRPGPGATPGAIIGDQPQAPAQPQISGDTIIAEDANGNSMYWDGKTWRPL